MYKCIKIGYDKDKCDIVFIKATRKNINYFSKFDNIKLSSKSYSMNEILKICKFWKECDISLDNPYIINDLIDYTNIDIINSIKSNETCLISELICFCDNYFIY